MLNLSKSWKAVPLTQLNIYVAGGCGLACQNCWTPNARSQADPALSSGVEHPALSMEIIMQAIREALPLGLRQVRFVGGDPLLHPNFAKLLDRIECLELAVTMETGGAGMTAARAARLARMPQCSVVLGLFGASPAKHDHLAGHPGAFDTVTTAARLLADHNLPPQLVFSIRRSSVRQIPAAIRLAETLGAASLRFVPARAGQPALDGFVLSGDMLSGDMQSDDMLSVEELIALGRKVERNLASGTQVQLMFDQPPAFRGLQPYSTAGSQERCGILNSLSLLPGGVYALCGIAAATDGAASRLTFGQVGLNRLEQVWREHPILNRLRQGMPNRLEGICERCTMKKVCLGNCAIENYLRTGNFWSPYWFCEAADRAGLFPASRLIENQV